MGIETEIHKLSSSQSIALIYEVQPLSRSRLVNDQPRFSENNPRIIGRRCGFVRVKLLISAAATGRIFHAEYPLFASYFKASVSSPLPTEQQFNAIATEDTEKAGRFYFAILERRTELSYVLSYVQLKKNDRARVKTRRELNGCRNWTSAQAVPVSRKLRRVNNQGNSRKLSASRG